MATSRRPSAAELQASYGRTVPDLVGPDLRVLLCGINPSLWSAAVGHHFARPGNRLWPTLHLAGFTSRRLLPEDTDELLAAGLGVTNLVARATARADELEPAELRTGVQGLRALVSRWRPAFVAVLGVSAYRLAFAERRAVVGRQPAALAGAVLWVLPNPSGLNASYQLPALVQTYGELRAAAYADQQG